MALINYSYDSLIFPRSLHIGFRTVEISNCNFKKCFEKFDM